MKTRKFKRIMGAATAASVLSTCIVGTNLMVGAEGETVTSDYTLTIPATLAVENSGWNALEGGISAKGTLESGKKLVVTPTSENSWNLVANKGEETESKVGYNLATTGDANSKYSAAAEVPTWEFTELTADGTSQTAGIVVDDYSEKPAGTYQDTVTFTASVEDNGPDISAYTSRLTNCTNVPYGSWKNDMDTSITMEQAQALAEYLYTTNGIDAYVFYEYGSSEYCRTINKDGKISGFVKSDTNSTILNAYYVAKASEETAKQLHSFTLIGPYTGDTLLVEFYDGDKWSDMVAKYSPITEQSRVHWVAFGTDGFIYKGSNKVLTTDTVDPNATYTIG